MTFKAKASLPEQFNNCNVMYNIAETMMPTVLKPEKERKNNDISDAGRKSYIRMKHMLQTFYLMLIN